MAESDWGPGRSDVAPRLTTSMPFAAVALLVAAAAAHAGWNLLVKEAKDRHVFMGVALVLAAVALAPAWITYARLPAAVWPLVVASGVAEAVYFALLVAMYAVSDFSLVYPIARGAAPLFLVVWAVLFLGQIPSPGGFLGLGILTCGLLIVSGGRFASEKVETQKVESRFLRGRFAPETAATQIAKSREPQQPKGVGLTPTAGSGRGIVLALCGAVCISAYTAIDGYAMQHAAPGAYLAAVLTLAALLIMPLVLWRYGWPRVGEEWRRNWWRIARGRRHGVHLSIGAVRIPARARPLRGRSPRDQCRFRSTRGLAGARGETRADTGSRVDCDICRSALYCVAWLTANKKPKVESRESKVEHCKSEQRQAGWRIAGWRELDGYA